jgi:hypothetical protein
MAFPLSPPYGNGMLQSLTPGCTTHKVVERPKQRCPSATRTKAKRIVMSAGFEPARVAPLAPEASALDHSARTPDDTYMFDHDHIRHILPGLTANVELSPDSVGASIEGHMLHNLPMGIMRKKKKIRDIYRYSSLKPGVYKKMMTGPFVPPPPLSSTTKQTRKKKKKKANLESRI